MKIIAKTRKSHYYNEDRFIIAKDFAMVVDGATSLEKFGYTPTEACWLVNRLKKEIVREHGSVESRLAAISRRAYADFKQHTQDAHYLPSAGLAWVEFDKAEIIAHTIGDCEIVVIKKDGSIIQLLNPELVKLDKYALQKMEEEANLRHIPFLKARPYVDQLLIEHRRLINKENGYTAFTLDEQGDFHYLTRKFVKDEIAEIYLFTDGLALAYDELEIYPDVYSMFKKSLDLEEEIEKIVQKSYRDPLCNRYHRFKLLDDITAIKITF